MGIRVIKTAVAVIAAIYLANALGLSSPLYAGLLAVLGVDVTKRKGIHTSLQRLGASVVGLVIAAGIYGTFGFQIWAIGLFVLLHYPIVNRIQLKEGIVTSSVVMFHVFGAGTLSLKLLSNEVALLLVGLGTATVINVLYMPKVDKELQSYRERVEVLFSQICKEIANHLRNSDYIWSGQELLDCGKLLGKAVLEAKRHNDNSLVFESEDWSIYFYMRQRQLEGIERMALLVARIYQTLPHGELLANVFEGLSEDVKIEYYTGRTEKNLLELEQRYRQMPLPQTREEFEIRAALLQLVEELKVYLSVAKKSQTAAARASVNQ